ncbi:hypothetical protein [Limnohabitans sp.]|uniref:hypothetical protein n=1 Tax=Limnohabitans sp. TaxID=1907725 RepID=UPI00286F4238|nr:hypothetical protein [Limnohabitans sp.]
MSEWMLDFFDEDNPWKAQAIDRITRNSIDLISRNAKYILDPKVFGDCDYLYVGRDVCRPGLGHFPRFSWRAPAEGYFCIKFVFSLINESNINGARIKVFKENSFCLENRILYSADSRTKCNKDELVIGG